MIYEVQKPEDATFATLYDGSTSSIARIIYIVSDKCGYGISVTVGGKKSRPECEQKVGSLTIRIAGEGWYGIDVAQLLTLHRDEYLLASKKGEFIVIGSDEFDTAYNIIERRIIE